MKDRTAYICFVIIVIMMIFMGFFVDKCPAQEYFQWRWSDQKVLDMPDASGLHLIGSGYMAGSFDNTGKWWKSDLTALAIGVAWEVKIYLPVCDLEWVALQRHQMFTFQNKVKKNQYLYQDYSINKTSMQLINIDSPATITRNP